MKPRFLAATGIFALAGVAALIATPASAKKRAPYARGEIVVVTGVVTDAGAGPLAEVEVVFAASRHAYDYLRLRKRTPVERRTAGQTASDGSFEIDWPWDDGFNHFELLVGITVAEPGGEYFH
ncbi:MAG: hypothetical protein OEW19_22130, partial [Acidobacteriota bacterium]|nr:hypothetical protein [Acidobacteriota bacterium]